MQPMLMPYVCTMQTAGSQRRAVLWSGITHAQRHVLTALVALIAVMSWGCLRQPAQLTRAEVEEIAWYVEDVCHGIDRNPYELAIAESSTGKREILAWALGTLRELESVAHPAALTVRVERWPLVRQGYRSGALQVDADGLPKLAPGIADEIVEVYRPIAQQERLDRLALVAILLARGQISPGSARATELTQALREARLSLDLAAGGKPWLPVEPTTDESESNSPTDPTTSTSNPDPFNRRDGF